MGPGRAGAAPTREAATDFEPATRGQPAVSGQDADRAHPAFCRAPDTSGAPPEPASGAPCRRDTSGWRDTTSDSGRQPARSRRAARSGRKELTPR